MARIEFTTQYMAPIYVDGVEYTVRAIKTKDILVGGFSYELTKKYTALIQEFQAKKEAGTLEEMEIGAEARILSEYRCELLKEFTSMPEDVINELPVLVMREIAHYVETGEVGSQEAIVPKNVQGADQEQRNIPDQMRLTDQPAQRPKTNGRRPGSQPTPAANEPPKPARPIPDQAPK